MYNQTQIKAAGLDLVGWSTSNDSLYSSIARTDSDSGYYVNELPGISVDLLNYVDDEKNVSDYVNSVHSGELLKVINSFVGKQKKDLNTKELLQHNTLIHDYNDLDDVITKDGRFVGYVLTPKESNTITSKILQVGLMTSAADSFTLYLYDTSIKATIQSKTITTTAADTIKWTDLDWDISFDRADGSAGQRYLIGYYEDDVTADIYEGTWNGSCRDMAQRVFGHYMGISPVRFNSGTLNGVNIPTLEYLRSSLNCRTPGFNLRFNTKCDITQVLVDNITMFGEALQYQIAVRILTDALSYTTLNNVTNAKMLRDEWKSLVNQYNFNLHGWIREDGVKEYGLMDYLSIDFSSIDAVCLKNRVGKVRGVRW